MSDLRDFETLEPQDSGFPRLKRKLYEHRWVVGVCILAFFVFELPGWDGGSNLGTAAWMCSMSVAIVIEIFWASRRKLWFPITISLIIAAHVVMFYCMHWTKQQYFGAEYRGIGMADGVVVYFVMWFARGIAGDGWSDGCDSQNKIETERGLDRLAHD